LLFADNGLSGKDSSSRIPTTWNEIKNLSAHFLLKTEFIGVLLPVPGLLQKWVQIDYFHS
jgi:hypothetical protein